MNFGRKHLETETSFSHELSIFLKDHMPLRTCMTYPITTL